MSRSTSMDSTTACRPCVYRPCFCILLQARVSRPVSVYCWLVGCALRPIDSGVIHRQHAHLLSLAKDVKLGFILFPPGIKPRDVPWQSLTLPLCHASSTVYCNGQGCHISCAFFIAFWYGSTMNNEEWSRVPLLQLLFLKKS